MKPKLNKFFKKHLPVLVLAWLPSLALADTGQDMLSSVLNGLIGLLTSSPV